jgi:hypothetical protein
MIGLTSISPDLGHSPYTLSVGNIQIAGHNQSLLISLDLTNHGRETYPVGILAVTSTFPYLILAFPLVIILALMTGLMIVPKLEFETAAH